MDYRKFFAQLLVLVPFFNVALQLQFKNNRNGKATKNISTKSKPKQLDIEISWNPGRDSSIKFGNKKDWTHVNETIEDENDVPEDPYDEEQTHEWSSQATPVTTSRECNSNDECASGCCVFPTKNNTVISEYGECQSAEMCTGVKIFEADMG